MATGRRATIIRVLKPIVAGIALAYLVTAFVDKPAAVHFQLENPYAAKQEEIVEPQTSMVSEKNVMKLGSPLTVRPEVDVPTNNPLAPLEEMGDDSDVNSTASAEADNVNATPAVRGGVEEAPAAP